MKVADILRTKGNTVMTVRPQEAIGMLVHRLTLERVGAMVVSEKGNSVDGIVSERDVTRGLAEFGTRLMDMHVSDIMTTAVVTCGPDDDVSEVARTMTTRRVRHVPVRDRFLLVGVVSIGDVVKHRLDEMELEANVLRDYAIARG